MSFSRFEIVGELVITDPPVKIGNDRYLLNTTVISRTPRYGEVVPIHHPVTFGPKQAIEVYENGSREAVLVTGYIGYQNIESERGHKINAPKLMPTSIIDVIKSVDLSRPDL